jgi:ribosomal protein S18 acetylase RimI-like enzyme
VAELLSPSTIAGASLTGSTRSPDRPDRPAPLIRRADPDDAAAIARVKVETWRTAYRGLLPDALLDGLDPADDAAFRRRGLETLAPDRVAFVAEVEREIVGFVTAGRERSGRHPGYRGEVYAIYVVDRLQRQGIGRALIRTAATELVRRGLSPILIWTLYDNPRSRAWYEAQGGVVVGEKREPFEGYELHEVGYGWTDPAPLL